MFSILVVTYNTRRTTVKCLRSIFKETRRTSFEIIVVDNASQDGSADAIAAEFGSRIRLIRSERNVGFACANNLAATKATSQLLLLLNPDTVVRDGALDKLMTFAKSRSEAGIWGGRTVFADGTLNPASCWRRQTLWSLVCMATGLASMFRMSGLFNPEAYGGWRRDTVREVDIVSGCFMLIRRELWNQLGGFDERFFMYGEDADLCLRARRFGVRPLICPAAQIVHHGGCSEPGRADKIIRLYRAKMRLVDRHLPFWQHRPARLLQRLNVLRRWMLWSAFPSLSSRSAGRSCSVFAEVWHRRSEWLRLERE